jgi:hypothetical protein
MLPETTIQRLTPLLAGQPVDLAYYLRPLPRGVLTAAQGGLALLFAPTTNPAQRYDLSQRLRFQLIGVLPAGHTEVIVLNDARLAIAAAALAKGMLVYNRDEAHRLRYETMILSEMLDFTATIRRYLGAGAPE